MIARSTAGIFRARIAALLAIVALFSLCALSGWHEMHPDMPAPSHAQVVDYAADHEHSDADLDQVAAHAALHATALPATAAIPAKASAIPALWHHVPPMLMASIDLARNLRPPRS